ncbi:MAG: hypothetical protein H5T64_04655 [Chloroflexi bacterium]|nr:hypothetical protein [Chloroflexota bacterium]
MPVGEPSIFQSVVSFLERQKLEFSVEEEQYCDKITVRSGATTAYVSVYNSGKIVLGGRDSPLKTLLAEMKSAIETGGAIPGQALPFEIDKFPQTIQERVPDCDPVIVRFIDESIRCVRSDALLAAAFMLGAASERAINLLIHTYGDAIQDDSSRQQFLSRVNGRFISRKYDEFIRSYQSCRSKPSGILSQDLDVIIGGMFQFCRITRNEIGHPQIVPDLDKGVILANLGQFVKYIERIYQLINHFKENGVVV